MFSIKFSSTLAFVLVAQSALALKYGLDPQSCQGHAKLPTWSYENQEAWPAQSCRTKQYQSPININKNVSLTYERNKVIKSPLNFKNYSKWFDALIENDGRTVRVSPVDNMTTFGLLSGGPLLHVYKFSHFQFHWPSEHTFDGRRYALELQIVHHRADLTSEEALNEPDGYAIMALFYDRSLFQSMEMYQMFEAVQAIRKPLTSVCQRVYLGYLVPKFPEPYYTYKGSLTTPNCNESVIWILRTVTRGVNTAQRENFYKVDVGSKFNYRQIQPLDGRPVYYWSRF